MDLGIAGKVALVTASSKGLGFASAQALADEGCKVVISARTASTLRDAAERIGSGPDDVLAIPADVTDPAVPAQLVAQTVERFGRLDILVANAGGPPPARSLDVDDEQVLAAINANQLTSMRLVREALPHMRAAGWGRMVLITSSFIKEPSPVLALSNVARIGLWAWAKTAAADIAAEGITLNVAAPGIHATDRMRQMGLQPETRAGDPADFGKVVAFLCSAPAGFVNGTAVVVDGGAVRGLL